MPTNRITDDIITLIVERNGVVTHCMGLVHDGEAYVLSWDHDMRAAGLRLLVAWEHETGISLFALIRVFRGLEAQAKTKFKKKVKAI